MPSTLKHSIVTYSAGTTLFRDGDPRQFLHIVHKGQIAIYKMNEKGQRLPLAIIGSGEYLGETGLLDEKTKHGAYAVALTDVELIAIPTELILEQLKTVPTWLIALSRGLSQKLRAMNEMVRRNNLNDEGLEKAMAAVHEAEIKRKRG